MNQWYHNCVCITNTKQVSCTYNLPKITIKCSLKKLCKMIAEFGIKKKKRVKSKLN